MRGIKIGILLLVMMMIFSINSNAKEIRKSNGELQIQTEMTFSVVDSNKKVLDGTTIVVVGSDGKIIDTLKTDKNGEAKKKIAVNSDKRYPDSKVEGYMPRGTVTAIAFKEGYQESVVFEIGVVSGSSRQGITMYPVVKGERNEPNVSLGYNHHLEILSLVEKYAKIVGEETHQ